MNGQELIVLKTPDCWKQGIYIYVYTYRHCISPNMQPSERGNSIYHLPTLPWVLCVISIEENASMRTQRVNRARFTTVIAADNTDIGGVRGSGKQFSIGLAQEGQGRAG